MAYDWLLLQTADQAELLRPRRRSIMNFDDLKLAPAILKAVREQGYETPTPIQAQAIPAVLEGQDLLAGAQTGTGKTAAFTLPMLHKLAMSRSTPNKHGVLVSVPWC